MRNRHSNPLRDVKPLSPITTTTITEPSKATPPHTTSSKPNLGRRSSSSATQYERQRQIQHAQRTETEGSSSKASVGKAGEETVGWKERHGGVTGRRVGDGGDSSRKEGSARAVLRREDAWLGQGVRMEVYQQQYQHDHQQRRQGGVEMEMETDSDSDSDSDMDIDCPLGFTAHGRTRLGDSCSCGGGH